MSIKTYHTVVRIATTNRLVTYKRYEDDYYIEAHHYENYYMDCSNHPDSASAVVINQFVTEDDEEGE
jgi:hypothetical protein